MTASLFVATATFRKCLPEKVVFVLLNQADLLLTAVAWSRGFYELNPVIREMLAVPPLLITVKVAIPLLIAWLVPGRLLLPSVVLLMTVVGWNLKEFLLYLV